MCIRDSDEGRYADAVRLYTAELATEEAKPAPSWVQLSHLNNQLGPDHPDVAISYHNIAFVYKAKKDLPKAKEYWEKAHAILLKNLGPNHPHTKLVKGQLDALNE